MKILVKPIVIEAIKKHPPTVYATTSAAFVHFILVQLVALGFAVVCKGWNIPIPHIVKAIIHSFRISENFFVSFSHIGWFLGFWIFSYSIACGVAATMRIFMLSRWFAALAAATKK